jgi:hypothetical protein
LSGEGASDMGVCRQNSKQHFCSGNDYLPGPMARIVDAIIVQQYCCSAIDNGTAVFVDGAIIEQTKHTLKPSKKSIRLPGGKIKIETRFHFEDARAFAVIVGGFVSENSIQDFVAVLFRDSNTDTEWQNKWNSMVWGFEIGFTEKGQPNAGVPMLPCPISEAWLLCAIYRQENPHQNCDKLEKTRHGEQHDHALKIQFETLIGEHPSRELLNDHIISGKIDHTLIDLPSFNDFKRELVSKVMAHAR